MMAPKEGVGLASGKVILFGEHAVVYGTPAIAASLSRGALARATFASTDSFRLDGHELLLSHDLLGALGVLRRKMGAKPLALDLALKIPKGAGLGASAAMGVASARAIASLLGRGDNTPSPFSEDDLCEAVQEWESVFHGNPSGVDVAAACSSGAIIFQKEIATRPLALQVPLHLAIAQAGPPASTKEMVEGVAKFKRRNPTQFQRNLDAICAIVDNSALLLRSGDLKGLGKLMDLNQILLSSWMLSTQEIETACHLAREAGALGSKLTGAGGGGSVIALAAPATSEIPHPEEAILQAWRQAGLSCFSTRIGTAP